MGNILKRVPNIFYSISATTRKPRNGERDGVDYFFRAKGQFEEEIEAGSFLEWAKVYGDFYGTPIGPIADALEGGAIVILEIDVQGAMQVKERVGSDAVYLFIAPPSVEELGRRLGARKTEAADQIQKRMETAVEELRCADRYDEVIVNDDLDRASDDLARVLVGARR